MSVKASLFLVSFLVAACSQAQNGDKKKPGTVPGVPAPLKAAYDFSHPKSSRVLPDELKEISGIAWVDNTHFMVIEDLHPQLYLLRAGTTGVIETTVPFKKTDQEKVDIEDVTIKRDTVYALWSHGKIFRITNWRKNPTVVTFTTPLTKEDNTEGLCYDPLTNSLLIACKDKSGVQDEKKSTRAIYAFDLKTGSLRSTPFMLIHKKDFEKVAGEKIDFFPSAIAVHPQSNDIYILSTKENKCLAIFDHGGKLKSFYYLDKEIFPQPEGICFAPDGRLFISSQGRHGKQAVIYEFPALK